MRLNHFIYQWEREAIRLRYSEGLTRQQIADKLGLRFAQVKYIFSKPNVKHYIRTEIMPALWEQEIGEIEEKLADPIMAYAMFLIECTEAQTYQWLGPGQKHYQSNNKKRLQALKRIGRIYGLTGDQKTTQRDLRKSIHKYTEQLEAQWKFFLFKWRHSTY